MFLFVNIRKTTKINQYKIKMLVFVVLRAMLMVATLHQKNCSTNAIEMVLQLP